VPQGRAGEVSTTYQHVFVSYGAKIHQLQRKTDFSAKGQNWKEFAISESHFMRKILDFDFFPRL